MISPRRPAMWACALVLVHGGAADMRGKLAVKSTVTLAAKLTVTSAAKLAVKCPLTSAAKLAAKLAAKSTVTFASDCFSCPHTLIPTLGGGGGGVHIARTQTVLEAGGAEGGGSRTPGSWTERKKGNGGGEEGRGGVGAGGAFASRRGGRRREGDWRKGRSLGWVVVVVWGGGILTSERRTKCGLADLDRRACSSCARPHQI